MKTSACLVVVLFAVLILHANAYPTSMYCNVEHSAEHVPTLGTVYFGDIFQYDTHDYKFPKNANVFFEKAMIDFIAAKYNISTRDLSGRCQGGITTSDAEELKAEAEQRHRTNRWKVVETGWTYGK